MMIFAEAQAAEARRRLNLLGTEETAEQPGVQIDEETAC